MLFSFECPTCGGKLEADASLSGSQAGCPQCGSLMAIPEGKVGEGTTLGGFLFNRRLGKGGMGEVYLARQLSVDRRVAIKVLPPGFAENEGAVRRFLQEGQLAARLDHANIATVYEAGEDSGNYYLAMAYIDGESLDARLKRDGALPEAEALAVVRAVAEALAYAWDGFRLLHRDIKPANIMVDRRKRVFLMDLGLAKSLSDQSGMTMSGTILGTPQYMSPEQAQGKSDLGVASDIYSLGATLYHLATGTAPYAGDSVPRILHGHVYEPLPPPRKRNPNLGIACAGLIESMMAKNPQDRPGDWRALLADLDRVRDGTMPDHTAGPVSIGKASLAQQAREALARQHQPPSKQKTTIPAWRRKPWLVGIGGAVALTLILAVSLALRGRKPSVPAEAQTPTAKASEPERPTAIVESTPAPLATPKPDRVPASPKPEPAPVPPTRDTPAYTQSGVQWQSLFDGRTLNGWTHARHVNGTADFAVLNGCIVGTTRPNTPNSFLCTDRQYADFVLEFEFQVSPDLNSGVQFRSICDPAVKNGRVHGYQVEIDPTTRGYTGGIFDESGRGWLCNLSTMTDKAAAEAARNAFRADEWNHVRLEAVGDRIRTWVNGVPVADLTDGHVRQGLIALQVHAASDAKPKQIRWRNIRIQDLGGGDEARVTADPTPPPELECALSRLILAGRIDEARQTWDKDDGQLGRSLPAAQRQAIESRLEALAEMPGRILASFRADVGKTGPVLLARGEIACTIREATDDGIKVYELIRQGETVGRVGRTIRYGELSAQEKLRRLGEEETPELGMMRGLLAVELGRFGVARRLFEQAGEPLGAALRRELDTREADTREAKAESAADELLRQIGRPARATERGAVIEGIRDRCSGSPKRLQSAQGLLARFDEKWGDSGVGRKLVPAVREALTFPFEGIDWTVPDVGMEFVWIESMKMWIGKYEVTNGEYRVKEPGHDSHEFGKLTLNRDRQPVVKMSWEKARDYAVWLTAQEDEVHRLPAGYRYRLPTGDEFVTYAQCGDGREYPWGDSWPPPSMTAGNFAGQESHLPGQIADYSDAHPVTSLVEESLGNPWGIFGIAGNAWECCAADRSPTQSLEGWRGGSWNRLNRNQLRCNASTTDRERIAGSNGMGFRLVLAP